MVKKDLLKKKQKTTNKKTKGVKGKWSLS